MTSEPRAGDRPLLSVDEFALSFSNGSGPRIQAVESASLTVFPRQTVAIVGESGCGKSVTAMSMLGLVPSPPSRVDGGSMRFESSEGPVDLLAADTRRLRRIRGGDIAMIFQEPMTSLNPVFTIGEQLLEAIRLHRGVRGAQAEAIAIEALNQVGIREPERGMRSFPHEYSGGMRQRAMIAMALACQPRLLIADEPTTALDVTIQKQILELIAGLRDSHDMAVVLITHDLGVVAEHADVVCVMYAGRVVEYAATSEIFRNPRHPYTRALLACIPSLDPRQSTGAPLQTVVGVTENEREWTRLAEELGVGTEVLRPWWVWHRHPDAEHAGEPARLAEISPGHWVAVWETAALRAEADRFPASAPSLTTRRQRSHADGGSHAMPAAR